jgi:hypothetical protein
MRREDSLDTPQSHGEKYSGASGTQSPSKDDCIPDSRFWAARVQLSAFGSQLPIMKLHFFAFCEEVMDKDSISCNVVDMHGCAAAVESS